MWVRGLKLTGLYFLYMPRSVAPYVGAWIETKRSAARLLTCLSHPMWVRGLKLIVVVVTVGVEQSHPMWVRGLKHGLENGVRQRPLCRTLCGCVD